jgi:hypothetical protein
VESLVYRVLSPAPSHLRPVLFGLQVAICVLHVQRTFVDEGWFSVLVASQQVLLWMKLVSTQCGLLGRAEDFAS